MFSYIRSHVVFAAVVLVALGFLGGLFVSRLSLLTSVTAIPAADQCGNEVLEGAEECDDGNLVNGDGCSSACAIEVAQPLDSDGDGVLDVSDSCPGSTLENVALNPNQYAQNLISSAFEYGKNNEQSKVYSMENTRGCSCEQIVDALGIGDGHEKKGCSPGIMERWTGISSNGKLR